MRFYQSVANYNSMLKYSVLMSIYIKENPDFFLEALKSLLVQTVKPDQIVIIKDGILTDRLEDIISNYIASYPNIFTVASNDINLGLGISLNKGLSLCRNELVARMDTDDISKPERCEKQLSIFNQNPELSIVGSWVDEFIDDPTVVISTRKVPSNHVDIYKYGKRRTPFNHPTVMFKKSDVISIGGYSDLRRNQDVDLFGRMLFAGFITCNIDESLLLMRSNNDLAVRRKSWLNTKSYINTIWKLKKMGYSSFLDYLLVASAQLIMFLVPLKIQSFIYKKYLRG
ncbi:MAG: glycosyltransferase [Acholeplasma sp.]|nr:glycosyltransferase [Acholeplasma sp.]